VALQKTNYLRCCPTLLFYSSESHADLFCFFDSCILNCAKHCSKTFRGCKLAMIVNYPRKRDEVSKNKGQEIACFGTWLGQMKYVWCTKKTDIVKKVDGSFWKYNLAKGTQNKKINTFITKVLVILTQNPSNKNGSGFTNDS